MVAQISIVFAAVAAGLTAMGLYGVLSYGVARRTAGVGLRKALGAGHGAVIALIMRETGWLLAAGLAAGGALAAGAAQLIASRSTACRRRTRSRSASRSPRWASSRSWRRGCRRTARPASIRSSRCGRNSAGVPRGPRNPSHCENLHRRVRRPAARGSGDDGRASPPRSLEVRALRCIAQSRLAAAAGLAGRCVPDARHSP